MVESKSENEQYEMLGIIYETTSGNGQVISEAIVVVRMVVKTCHIISLE